MTEKADIQNQIDNPELQKITEQFEGNQDFKDFKNTLDERCEETTETGKNEMLAGLQMF